MLEPIIDRSSNASCTLCLVVPYNEEEMLPFFLRTVVPELETATGGHWRIICVDDGSRDSTFAIIAREYVADQRVSGVRLSRNFGHQAPVSVAATVDVSVTTIFPR